MRALLLILALCTGCSIALVEPPVTPEQCTDSYAPIIIDTVATLAALSGVVAASVAWDDRTDAETSLLMGAAFAGSGWGVSAATGRYRVERCETLRGER